MFKYQIIKINLIALVGKDLYEIIDKYLLPSCDKVIVNDWSEKITILSINGIFLLKPCWNISKINQIQSRAIRDQ